MFLLLLQVAEEEDGSELVLRWSDRLLWAGHLRLESCHDARFDVLKRADV